MKNQTEPFAQKIRLFEYRYDLRTVFDDFLTMTLCAFAHNPIIRKSDEEALYWETIAKYKDEKLRKELPKLLACLLHEMTERLDSDTGWDVLGEFYEINLARKGASQFFTPWTVCTFMAKCSMGEAVELKESEPLRILDSACGSGRMLLASSRVGGRMHEYYGIDIDETCVKMTALNLFLSGLFNSEAMCGDALARDDFRVSYRSSFSPLGLFRIQQKEQSPLWHILQNTFAANEAERKAKTEPPELSPVKHETGSQLTFF